MAASEPRGLPRWPAEFAASEHINPGVSACFEKVEPPSALRLLKTQGHTPGFGSDREYQCHPGCNSCVLELACRVYCFRDGVALQERQGVEIRKEDAVPVVIGTVTPTTSYSSGGCAAIEPVANRPDTHVPMKPESVLGEVHVHTLEGSSRPATKQETRPLCMSGNVNRSFGPRITRPALSILL